ncbi:MAG TPA: TonB-dependent receptor [Acidobacteriaceae bacterium]
MNCKQSQERAPAHGGWLANNRRFSHQVLFVTSIAFFILLGRSSSAQTTFGTILGTVIDQTGSAVAGATVTLTNLGTSDKRTDQSDSSGNYQFVNLVPGNYSVDFEKTGFNHLKRDLITIVVQAAVRVDTTLQVGDVKQTVTVDTVAPIIETQPGSLGQMVEGKVVQEMPLNGRNILNLVALAPGVVPQGSVSGNPLGNQANGTFTNNTGWGNYQIGGGMANQSAFYLDGVPLNTTYINSPALVPTQDAIQEFRVDSNAVSAEFGRFAGGVVNMATKSGTDQLHGSAYEYIRNKVLNANTFFNNRAHIPTPAFTQNQYGVELGGPVRREKLFFFFSWEGFAFRTGNSITTTVPTAAMRNGDFSDPSLPPIFDPLTTCGLSGTSACPPGRTATRVQFPGNKIPTSRLDPAAAQYMKYYGLPNLPGTINNFATNVSLGGNSRQYNGRIDWNVSENQRVFARYTWWNGTSLPSDPFHTHFGGLNSYFGTQNFVIGDTYTFSPRTVADFRFSYLRGRDGFTPEQVGTNLALFGPAWAALAPQVTLPVAPLASISGVYNFNGTDNRAILNDYSLSSSLIKILGRHTFKFGGEVRRNQWNFAQSSTAAGTFSFDQGFTALNPTNLSAPYGSTTKTGYSVASFYLGNPATGTAASIAFTNSIEWYGGLYFQDTFAVSKKLTVTPGVRWDLPQGFTEVRDRLTVLQPNAIDPLGAVVGLPLTGQLALVNSSAYPNRTQIEGHHKLFAPRVNVAYYANPTTSIRGGYGLSWIPPDMINYNMAPFQSPVNAATTTMVSSIGGTSELLPAATFGNPFPTGLIPPIGHDPSRLGIFEGQSISSPVPTEAYGYAQQWNLEIQQELGSSLMFDIGYAGSKATHLSFLNQQLNQLPDGLLAMGPSLNTQVSNPFYGHITSGLLSNRTVSRAQLLRPHPQFQNFQDTAAQHGGSHWSALETRVVKRFKTGGVLQGSYTWAKLIGNTDTLTSWLENHGVAGVQDWNNLNAEMSRASFDVRNRFVASYVVNLPFGNGQHFWGNAGPLLNRVVGGWSVNGITTLQSGYPLALTTATNVTGSQGGGSRPNVINQNKKLTGAAQSRLSQWFNTAAFAQPAAFTFGNETRTDSSIRDAGIANWDFTIGKAIPITERFNFQFKTELFNLFNRVQFGDPGTQLGSATFGIVSSQLGNPRLIQFSGRLIF